MPGVATLRREEVVEALGLLGQREFPQRAAARLLRELLTGQGFVRALLDRGPQGAREAFVRLAHDGPAPVEALLGRGWWGRGLLPPPLDWLQRRALVTVDDEGLVAAVDEARKGFCELTLDVVAPMVPPSSGALRVEEAGCALVSDQPAVLDRALSVTAADLRVVAPTVAVSSKSSSAVRAALRAAGLPLTDDLVVPATPSTPALPGSVEEAVGPRGVRALLGRAVAEQRQLRLIYFASSRGGAATERTVDPWRFGDDLLVGWCHLRDGERTFAVDRIGSAHLLPSVVEHAAPA